MDKYLHILFGTLLFLIIYLLFNLLGYNYINNTTFSISLIICLTYSLIPDLDLKNSWIKKQFNKIIIYILIILAIFYFIDKKVLIFIVILIGIEVILYFIKHRGILHSLPVGIILAFPLYFLNPIYFIAGCIGFFSHWLGDKL